VLKGAEMRAPDARLAFLFTGQGAQYFGMGQGLYNSHEEFARIIERCDRILEPLLGYSLVSILYSGDEPTVDLAQTLYAQPALFALEYALASVWQSAGLQPDYLIGHSLGEYVAACRAGVFTLEDGLFLVAHRARLMQEYSSSGAMVAVRGSTQLIAELLKEFEAGAHSQVALA